MTIKDIAKESGYAIGTVSRVLNNNPSVSPAARAKILEVIKRYNYQPNSNAKHLKQQSSDGLALIVKGTQNMLFVDILEKMQHGDGDLTEWLVWYLQKLIDALDEAEAIVTSILNKSFFWQKASSIPMTERQTEMLNLFLDGYESKITSKTWASLAKCSKDTAIRDIQDLVEKNILVIDIPGAKRPSYSIVYDAEDLTQFFADVTITEEKGISYLCALFKGKKQVRERLLKLDAERYLKDDLPLSNLLGKYCSYLMAGK